VRFDIGHGVAYGDWVGQIDLHITHGQTFAPQLCRSGFAAMGIANAYEDARPFFAKLAGDLEAYALVGGL
jgi:hypothetical protein